MAWIAEKHDIERLLVIGVMRVNLLLAASLARLSLYLPTSDSRLSYVTGASLGGIGKSRIVVPLSVALRICLYYFLPATFVVPRLFNLYLAILTTRATTATVTIKTIGRLFSFAKRTYSGVRHSLSSCLMAAAIASLICLGIHSR